MREIKGTTRVCGLIGNPVEHSISPLIHNTLAKICDIDLAYVTFKVEAGKVASAVEGAFDLNVLGMNVTVPHKQDVINSLSDIDPLAKAIGAVNTLVRTDNGYKGYNTDIIGLERELSDAGVSLCDRQIILLGAGGAARAIAFLCADKGAKKVYILNRTVEKAASIARSVNGYFNNDLAVAMNIDDYNSLSGNDYIVIQTTSVGLHPHDDDVVIDDDLFYEKIAVGVDIIYNPAKTKFMKLVEKKGKPAMNGLKMLLYQGVAAFELWNNVNVSQDDVNAVYEKMKKALGINNDNIVLIGFMGSGKTTLGKWIAKENNMKFVDTDEIIVKKEGRSINDIFASDGEAYFRNLETEVISELIDNSSDTVISVGGGLPVKPENRPLLKKLGNVVYLKTSEDELVKRLSNDTTRPLLKGDDLRGKIQNLMNAREAVYEETAGLIVDTDNKSLEEIYSIIKNC